MDFSLEQYGIFRNEWKNSNKMSRELLFTSDDSGRVKKKKFLTSAWKAKSLRLNQPYILKWFPFIVSSWNPEQQELRTYCVHIA